ncbi:MAG: CopG family transcriptional regulator [Pseudomonadota bacterium]
MKKQQLTVYLDPPVAATLEDVSARQRASKSKVVEAAVASFLSPDGPDQLEAVLTRRLDRMTRAIERLERNQDITTETVALFVKFWLTTTPPLPDEAFATAQARGKERYGGFVDTLARRLTESRTLTKELVGRTEAHDNDGAAPDPNSPGSV